MLFKLEVQQVDRSCLFRLSWEGGQQLAATLTIPPDILELYKKWQQAYLNFYKQGVRARVPKSKNNQGKISIPRDWHRQLVLAEANLLDTFHRWLRGEELYEIREKIKSESNSRVCITCNPLDLARLPWETWEVGNNSIVARSPLNIRAETAKKQLKRPRQPRLLVILGDDTGIDTQGDRDSIKSLANIADIEIVTWDLKQDKAEIREKIKKKLIDPKGWEILFFAGHSNESKITGGELAIAPGVGISVKEIAEQLTVAKNNGLRFALFNSCSGLSIANSLIDLGLNQVAIMREPIHNQVAQLFLVEFISTLGKNCDVGEALVAASKVLQTASAKYPSSYLIPSLYCHPEAELYRIVPWKWQDKLVKWLPTRREAIALSALCFLSLLPPVENFLLERRVLVQAVYRDLTGQITETTKPSIALIHIDNKSLTEGKIVKPVPMDRSYLASLIDAIATKEGKIIGLDYLFDLKQPNNDSILARSVTKAVNQEKIWFVFGAFKQNTGLEIGVAPETGIGDPNWTMQGYTDGLPNYVSLLPKSADCDLNCPFAYLLTMASSISQQSNLEDTPKPTLVSSENLRQQIYNYTKANPQNNRQLKFLKRTKLSPLTSFVQYLGQQWGRPITDFSLPPDLVYDRIPAWQLLTPENSYNFQEQTVIIGSGGYSTAGLTTGSDIFPTPPAVSYWQVRRGLQRNEENFTGSEFLAYMTHHLLQRRLVIPLPAIIAIVLGFLIAKNLKFIIERYDISPQLLLIFLGSGTAIYGLLGLQLYITAGILFPWLLPAISLSAYFLPALRINKQ